jgi:hypothetical protein
MWSRLIACTMLICLPVMTANVPARAHGPCAEGLLIHSRIDDDTLVLHWSGRIGFEMGEKIASEFDRVKSRIKRVGLSLTSCGGDRGEMERTVAVLRRIKNTHTLNTLVWRGATCASACIPIFLQGVRRRAALTSVWVFHESHVERLDPKDPNSRIVATHDVATQRILKDYYVPAGVSKAWLKRLRKRIKNAEWWQTGSDLWYDKSRIITIPITNRSPRSAEERRHFSPPVVCGSFCRG